MSDCTGGTHDWLLWLCRAVVLLTMCHKNVSLSCEILQFFYNVRCRCIRFWLSPGNQAALMVSAHCAESALCREPAEILLHSPENVSSTCRHSAQGQINKVKITTSYRQDLLQIAKWLIWPSRLSNYFIIVCILLPIQSFYWLHLLCSMSWIIL